MNIITNVYSSNNNDNSLREPEERSLSRSSSMASISSLRKSFFGKKVRHAEAFSVKSKLLSSKELFADHASLGDSVCAALNKHFKFKDKVKYLLGVMRNSPEVTNQQISTIETFSYKVCLVYYEKAKKKDDQIKFKVYSECALDKRSKKKNAVGEGNVFSLKNKQYHPICSVNFIYNKIKNGAGFTVPSVDWGFIDPTEMCYFYPIHQLKFEINSDVSVSQENIIKACFRKYQQIFDTNQNTKNTIFLKSALPFDAV